MMIKKAGAKDEPAVIQMIHCFRNALRPLRNNGAVNTLEQAKAEYDSYVEKGYPIHLATDSTKPVGLIILKIEDSCVWVEMLYVDKAYRGSGVADRLSDEAEKEAVARGEETVYNNIHPNNHAMIRFLKRRGYDVLNLVEVRKRRHTDKRLDDIDVGDHRFKY